MSNEEEDTCMSYEEEDTCMSYGPPDCATNTLSKQTHSRKRTHSRQVDPQPMQRHGLGFRV